MSIIARVAKNTQGVYSAVYQAVVVCSANRVILSGTRSRT